MCALSFEGEEEERVSVETSPRTFRSGEDSGQPIFAPPPVPPSPDRGPDALGRSASWEGTSSSSSVVLDAFVLRA